MKYVAWNDGNRFFHRRLTWLSPWVWLTGRFPGINDEVAIVSGFVYSEKPLKLKKLIIGVNASLKVQGDLFVCQLISEGKLNVFGDTQLQGGNLHGEAIFNGNLTVTEEWYKKYVAEKIIPKPYSHPKQKFIIN